MGVETCPLYSEFRQSDLVRSNDDITDIIRWRVQLLWLKFAFQSYDFPCAVWDRKFFRLQIALWLQARAIWFAFE